MAQIETVVGEAYIIIYKMTNNTGFRICFKLQSEVTTINGVINGLCDRCGNLHQKHSDCEQLVMSNLFEAVYGIRCDQTRILLNINHPQMADDDICNICRLPKSMHPEDTSLSERRNLYNKIVVGKLENRIHAYIPFFASHAGMFIYGVLYAICYILEDFHILPSPAQFMLSQISLIFFGFMSLDRYLWNLNSWCNFLVGWFIILMHPLVLIVNIFYPEWLELRS